MVGDETDDIIEVAGKVVVVGIILLFFVVIFLCCLHLYFKWFYSAANIEQQAGGQGIPSSSSSSSVDDDDMNVHVGGLDGVVLKSIPIVVWLDPDDEVKQGLECAVCLCQVREGEKARILPKCNHGFHVECIDMWFHSHATCPLCRNPIIPIPQSPCPRPHTDQSSLLDHHHVLPVWGDIDSKDQPSTSAASHSHIAVLVDRH